MSLDDLEVQWALVKAVEELTKVAREQTKVSRAQVIATLLSYHRSGAEMEDVRKAMAQADFLMRWEEFLAE